MLRRAVMAGGLLALLAAPTPGAVGSCDGDELDGFADLQGYCTEREELICVRRWRRRELTEEQRDNCRREMIALCERRFWPRECRPTERKTRACLNALRSLDTLSTPEHEIEECNAESLCTVRPVDGGTDAP
jgi:hypothetical protein